MLEGPYLIVSRNNSVTTVKLLRTGYRPNPFSIPYRVGNFLDTPHIPGGLWGPRSCTVEVYWRLFCRALKLRRCGPGQSPPSSTKFKNTWGLTSTPPRIFVLRCLMRHSGDFTCAILKLVLITQKTFNRAAENTVWINRQKFLSHLPRV